MASRQTKHRGRFDSVPRYVVAKAAHAVKEEAQALRGGSLFEPTSLAQVPPRFSLRPSAAIPPAGLDVANMFRRRIGADSSVCGSRCQVPVQVYDVLKAMLVAATRAEELLDAVKEEMRQILGLVGAPRENVELASMAASA